MKKNDIEARIDAIYARLPSINCKGFCHIHCTGVAMSTEEFRRLKQAAGGRLTVDRGDRCSILDDSGRCTQHPVRPLICRLYGVVEGMRCPYGCQPDYYLTDAEGHELMREMTKVGGKTKTDLVELAIKARKKMGQ